MKMIFSALMVCLASCLYSQVIVGDININNLEHITICQVVATGKLFSNKVTITIDYGQSHQGLKASSVLTRTGKRQVFPSVMSAINYMEANGWKYFDALAVTTGASSVYHYNFRKVPNWEPPK